MSIKFLPVTKEEMEARGIWADRISSISAEMPM